MKKVFTALFTLALLANLVIPLGTIHAMGTWNSGSASDKAQQMLQKMSPAEKVGQLFLVSFKGTDVSETSQIYDLVLNRRIGGVVLDQANDNFSGPDNTLSSAQALITSLQKAAMISAQSDSPTPSSAQNHIPLFIGIAQEGDGAPNDQLLNGMTPLADEMAIGATWNAVNAEQTGKILGMELTDIGFNLLLGPSLDVLDSTQSTNEEDLGVRCFGGDPYWVGVMGQAYIKGLHEGSNNQLAVIAKNFPGRGSADRPAENEVATVRKSLEQLKQIELAPFFAVTGSATDLLGVTDGLLVSHIRYQGFQGNIRATTKPISLDSAALDQIMALPNFASWRANGGVVVSDNLGTTSIQKFFDPTGVSFDAWTVAKTAFLAGNDLLYVGNLTSSGDADSYTSLIKVLDLFTQKYKEDQSFASKVDAAVLRILTLKYRQYPNFSAGSILPSPASIQEVGISAQVTTQVANEAVTLINPDASDLDTVLPDPPQTQDRIVFISDVVKAKQCSTCGEQIVFSSDDFLNAVIKLYGSDASGEVQRYHLSAYSFDDLENMLDQQGDTLTLQDSLSSADWIVFSFVGQDGTAISKLTLQRFLSSRPDLLRNKKIIGFAFNAPYYLDATDISKLTAYYGVYGKTAPFINAAARVLFQEFIPGGNLPVSVSGVGYDIITATTPDPNQVIQLMVDNGEQISTTNPQGTPTQTPTLIYNVGDTLSIRTGVIKDHNANPVPDGTVVRFMIDTGSSSGTVETVETTTSAGIAKTSYRISNKGLLGITVQAEPATISQTLSLDITDNGGVLTAIEPTILPTDTEMTQASTASPNNLSRTNSNKHNDGVPSAGDWFLTTFLVVVLCAAIYWLGSLRTTRQWGIRWAVISGLGGYITYLYLVLGFPGSAIMIKSNGSAFIILITLLGIIIGWGAAVLWWWITQTMRTKK